jgi:hypothetical protein
MHICPRVPTQEPSRVVSPSPLTPAHSISSSPSWSPPPRPAVSTLLSPTTPFQATPRQLDFTGAPSPRVGFEPRLPSLLPPPSLPAREPIAYRTRCLAPTPSPLALFTAGRPLHESLTRCPRPNQFGPLLRQLALQVSAVPCRPQRLRYLQVSANHCPC